MATILDNTAAVRFYEELNDFLPPSDRKRDIPIRIAGPVSVERIIKELGVPCSRVDLILINGRSAGFDLPVRAGDRISVYPVFERFNIEKTTRLPGRPLRRLRFLADSDLEELARRMEKKGYDVAFDPDLSPEELVERAGREHRVILTQSSRISRQQGLSRVVRLSPDRVERQLCFLADQLDLAMEDR